MIRKVKAWNDEDLRGWTKDAFNEALSFHESSEFFIFLKYAFHGLLVTRVTLTIDIKRKLKDKI